LTLDSCFMIDQLLIGLSQIAQVSVLIRILQDANASNGRQTFFVGVAPRLPFVYQDEISR